MTKVETTVQENAKKPDSQLSRLAVTQSFPFRPGFGTKGTSTVVWANYVEMMTPTGLTLYRYDVAVTPECTGRKLKQIVSLLLDSPDLAPFKEDLVTDFTSTLISRKELSGEEINIDILYRSERHAAPRHDAPTYTVRLRRTNVLSVEDFVNQPKSTTPAPTFADKLPTIQALNIFLNHHSHVTDDLIPIGSSKVFSRHAASHPLGTGLVAIRGFFASVRPATARILVNVNVSHGAFYKADRLDNVMRELPRNELGGLNSFVTRLRIETIHVAGVRRVKTVFGLATLGDGRVLEHPPKVAQFGAGPKDVEFWDESLAGGAKAPPVPGLVLVDDGSKKKKRGRGGPGNTGGAYISVFDHFKKSESAHTVTGDLP